MTKKKSNDDGFDEEEETSGLKDFFRKVVSVGVGSAFMTEESVKNLLHDLPLPKDLLTGLLQNARQAKTDFIETVREELKEQFTRIDPAKLVDEVVERYDIEVQATFKFKRKPGAPAPTTTAKKKGHDKSS